MTSPTTAALIEAVGTAADRYAVYRIDARQWWIVDQSDGNTAIVAFDDAETAMRECRAYKGRAGLVAVLDKLMETGPSEGMLDAATENYLATGSGSPGTVEQTAADFRAMLAELRREITDG